MAKQPTQPLPGATAVENPPAPPSPAPPAGNGSPTAVASQDQPIVQPLTGTLPPVLGKTPTALNQILPRLGGKAVHFAGPVSSGPTSSALGVQGSSLLTLTLQLDYTMKNFNLPIQFPPNSLLIWAAGIQYAAFAATEPSFSLGKTSGATDILAATALGAGAESTVAAFVTGTLPFWTDPVPWQAWLNITGNATSTAGGALIVLAYARLMLPWS